VIAAVAAMVAATLAGLLAHRRDPAGAQRAGRGALSALLWVVMPFVFVLSLPSLRMTGDLVLGAALGWVAIGTAGIAAWAIGTHVLRLPRPTTAALILTVVIANTGYFGLPFVRGLLGRDDLPTAIVFDALVSGPMFYVVGVTIAAVYGHGPRATPRERARRVLLRNPVLVAAIVGLALPGAWIPGVLVSAAHTAVWALLALGFFALGVTLAAEHRAGALTLRIDAALGTALALRLLLVPALYIGLTELLTDVPASFRLESAMPVGLTTLVLAHAADLDLRLTASAIAWSATIVATWGLIAAAV